MKIDFDKSDLIPAIVQDSVTARVLMLGFMNEEALKKTEAEKVVTFFSRSKGRLWTKGETSGNKLLVDSIAVDCDSDTVLIKARPTGPICHTGADTCFNEKNTDSLGFLDTLASVIRNRKENPQEKSYVASLFKEGKKKIAQKVGEEAVELVLESGGEDRERFIDEASDLLFHYLVLLEASEFELRDVVERLRARHR